MASEQVDTAALVERVVSGVGSSDVDLIHAAYAALDSLTAALERAERERGEWKTEAEHWAGRKSELLARAQKAEAVVRHAPTPEYVGQWGVSAYQRWYDGSRRAALTAYDEPPTEPLVYLDRKDVPLGEPPTEQA